MDSLKLTALASQWRLTAHQVAADIKGKPGRFGAFRPTGQVKAKMSTQVSVLLTCAAQLEAVIESTNQD
jgi:hypothetical protein